MTSYLTENCLEIIRDIDVGAESVTAAELQEKGLNCLLYSFFFLL